MKSSRKKLTVLFALVLVFALSIALAACTGGGEEEPQAPTIVEISIGENTVSTIFVNNSLTNEELLQLLQIEVMATMSDNNTVYLNLSDCVLDYSDVVTSTAGTYTVQVSYQSLSTSFEVTVTEPTVSGIGISEYPKMYYDYGEPFTYEGLKLLVTYVEENAAAQEIASGFTVDSSAYNAIHGLDETQSYAITVNYGSASLEYQVNVNQRTQFDIVGFKVVTMPKTQFEYGEEYSANGLVITLLLDNGFEQMDGQSIEYDHYASISIDSTAYVASHGIETEGGQDYEIEISYGEFTKDYTVNVARAPAHVVSFELDSSSTYATSFAYGAPFNSDGLKVVATMSYGDAVEYSANEITIVFDAYLAAHDKSTAQSYPIFVYYGNELVDTYTVTVAAIGAPIYESIRLELPASSYNTTVFVNEGAEVYAVTADGRELLLASDKYSVTCEDFNGTNTTGEVVTYKAKAELTSDAQAEYGLTGSAAIAEFDVFVFPRNEIVNVSIDTSNCVNKEFAYGYTATAADFEGLIVRVEYCYGENKTVVLDESGTYEGLVIDLDGFNGQIGRLSDDDGLHEITSAYFTRGCSLTVSYEGVEAYTGMEFTRLPKPDSENTVCGIEIVHNDSAYQMLYRVGDGISANDEFSVLATYTNGTTRLLDTTEYTVAPSEGATFATVSNIGSARISLVANSDVYCVYQVIVVAAGALITSIDIPSGDDAYAPQVEYGQSYESFNELKGRVEVLLDNGTTSYIPFTNNMVEFIGFDNTAHDAAYPMGVSQTITVRLYSDFITGGAEYVESSYDITISSGKMIYSSSQDLLDYVKHYYLGESFVMPTGYIQFMTLTAVTNYTYLDISNFDVDYSAFNPNVAGTYTISLAISATGKQIQLDEAYSDSFDFNVYVYDKTAQETLDSFDFNLTSANVMNGSGLNAVTHNGKSILEGYGIANSYQEIGFDSSFYNTCLRGVDNTNDAYFSFRTYKCSDPTTGAELPTSIPADAEAFYREYFKGDDLWYCLVVTLKNPSNSEKLYFVRITEMGSFFDSFQASGTAVDIDKFSPTVEVGAPDINSNMKYNLSFTVSDGRRAEVWTYVNGEYVALSGDGSEELVLTSGASSATVEVRYYFNNSDVYMQGQLNVKRLPYIESITVNDSLCDKSTGSTYIFSTTVTQSDTYDVEIVPANGYTYTISRYTIEYSGTALNFGPNFLTIDVYKNGQYVDNYFMNIIVECPILFGNYTGVNEIVVDGTTITALDYGENGKMSFGLFTDCPKVYFPLNTGVSVSAYDLQGAKLNWVNGAVLPLADGKNLISFVFTKDNVSYSRLAEVYYDKNVLYYSSIKTYLDCSLFGYEAQPLFSALIDYLGDDSFIVVLPRSERIITADDLKIGAKDNGSGDSLLYNGQPIVCEVVGYENCRFMVSVTFNDGTSEENTTGYLYVYVLFDGEANSNVGINYTVEGSLLDQFTQGEDGVYRAAINVAQGSSISVQTKEKYAQLISYSTPLLYTENGISYLMGDVGDKIHLYYFVTASDGTRATYEITVTLSEFNIKLDLTIEDKNYLSNLVNYCNVDAYLYPTSTASYLDAGYFVNNNTSIIKHDSNGDYVEFTVNSKPQDVKLYVVRSGVLTEITLDSNGVAKVYYSDDNLNGISLSIYFGSDIEYDEGFNPTSVLFTLVFPSNSI